MIDIFLEDAPQLLGRLKASCQLKNSSELHHVAHSLRGLTSNFDARAVSDPALRLEHMGGSNHEFDEETAATLEQLEIALGKLTEDLREFRP